MALINRKEVKRCLSKRLQWQTLDNSLLVIYFIFLIITPSNCQDTLKELSHSESIDHTKRDVNVIDSETKSNLCHSCRLSSIKSNGNDNHHLRTENIDIKKDINEEFGSKSLVSNLVTAINAFSEKYLNVNKNTIGNKLENMVDNVLKKDRYEIVKGVEIKATKANKTQELQVDTKGRALFSSYTYEYRILQKVKNFINTHVISIDVPKAAEGFGFRTFGLRKFLLPIVIGVQVFKAIIFALFLPSLLGSFGKILGKGLSQLSAGSNQASFPQANGDDQTGYSNDNKDFMGYESDPSGTFAYPQDDMYPNVDPNDVNDLSVDLSRYGMGGHKATYLQSSAGYYKNQMSSNGNNYKVFQKVPSSTMFLSNFDPFYSPILSRLDGIFARLGLAPLSNSMGGGMQTEAQSLSDVKLEACREQLICRMYASPAKYAPYSNLISAQLSRELNELQRPVSDNPEILRFFRYMRAARRGQEGVDCIRSHPACAATATPAHAMIAAYHDINKLVTARKLQK